MGMVGKFIVDMDYIDLYLCFLSVVEMVCDEFGIVYDDLCGLIFIGGFFYFGGFGNNYVMYLIVMVMEKVR